MHYEGNGHIFGGVVTSHHGKSLPILYILFKVFDETSGHSDVAPPPLYSLDLAPVTLS